MSDIILVLLLVGNVVSCMILFALGIIAIGQAKKQEDRHQEVIQSIKFLAEQNQDVLAINQEYLSMPVKREEDGD